MPIYRLRARLYFRPGNGMADWALGQNDVRLGMAYHLNAGRADEERSKHSAAADVYSCDLSFPDDLTLAQDTWDTLLAVCTDGYLRPPTAREVSWMDLHECQHEGTPTPCPTPTQAWSQEISAEPTEPTASAWVQPTGAHDAYASGDVVTHNGQTWTSTVDANTWEPGIYGWTVV